MWLKGTVSQSQILEQLKIAVTADTVKNPRIRNSF